MSKILTIKKNDIEASVNTFGSELVSFKRNGEEYMWCGDEAVWECVSPVLFPICGALKDDKMSYMGKSYSIPKHGFADKSEFTVVNHTYDRLELSISANKETFACYPFDFVFTTIYQIVDDGLKTTYRVENKGNGTMYYSVGAHEGIAMDGAAEGAEIEFDTEKLLTSYQVKGSLLNGETFIALDNKKVMTFRSEMFKNDAFIFKNIDFSSLKLSDKVSGRWVKYSFPEFENLLIWTKPHAKYICVELWNGLPDSVDSKGEFKEKEAIHFLESGKTKDFIHTLILGKNND